jgi:hypothetical protein
MSHLEICDALFADRPKLQIRAKSLIPKMAKQFKKERRFPAWKWVEYTHQQSHNRYQICFYAPTLAHADNPDVKYLAFLEEDHQRIVVQWGCWMYRKHGSMDAIATRYIGYFSGHFFSRYRERIWKNVDMSFNELLCRYFSRNVATIPLELNEDIQRNYKEYGELAKYAFQVPDGTCFIRHWNEGDETTVGQKDSDFISVVLYYTFVNGGMMTETQNKAILKEGTRYIRDYYKSLFEDVMKETFFRRLNTQKQEPIIEQNPMPQMISMEECEQIGCRTEDKVFDNIVKKLNQRHQSATALSYFDQLSIDLTQAEEDMQDSFPDAYAEIQNLMHEEYRALDELEQHCLFLYLFTNDKDENEIVDSMSWHFEEWMEDRGIDFLSKAKTNPKVAN